MDETLEQQQKDSDMIFAQIAHGGFDTLAEAKTALARLYIPDMTISRSGISHALKRLEKHFSVGIKPDWAQKAAEEIADYIERHRGKTGYAALGKDEVIEAGADIIRARYQEQEANAIVCKCGHPKAAHYRYSDHDECIAGECECDNYEMNLPVEGGSSPPVGKQPPSYEERLDCMCE